MNVLITGGAGYIGSVLTPRLLAAGHRVRVLDSLLHGGSALLPVWAHPGFEFLRGDVRDRVAVARALDGVDAVRMAGGNRTWKTAAPLGTVDMLEKSAAPVAAARKETP